METAQTERIKRPFYFQHPNGDIDFNLHEGQDRAIHSPARFILLLAGTQSGKTVTGPLWLNDEIARRGPGDYLCVAPSYPLMNKKVLPEFLRLFDSFLGLGSYRYGDRIFKFHNNDTQVFFGHGDDPDSLESATAKAAWLDECGQKKFRLFSWESIQRRLSINEGRVLMTTTPYDLGWLKQKIYDRCPKPNFPGDPDYELINFDSLMNPMFPEKEYERARATMPGWRFRMFYQGLFERPAGMIYDCFGDNHKVPRVPIPLDWKTYMGVDFGAVNTAAIFLAEEPETKKLYLYREYRAGGKTAKQHVADMLNDGRGLPDVVVGGSKSEGQWRDEFRAAGLPIREPEISEVELGINRVYGAHAEGKLVAFNDLEHYLEQKMSYSRVLDDMGQPTEKIDDKETFHLLDAERYIVGYLRGEKREFRFY